MVHNGSSRNVLSHVDWCHGQRSWNGIVHDFPLFGFFVSDVIALVSLRTMPRSNNNQTTIRSNGNFYLFDQVLCHFWVGVYDASSGWLGFIDYMGDKHRRKVALTRSLFL